MHTLIQILHAQQQDVLFLSSNTHGTEIAQQKQAKEEVGQANLKQLSDTMLENRRIDT
jgi:hypothetical protein